MKIKRIVLASAAALGMLGGGLAQGAVTFGPVEMVQTNGVVTYIYVAPAGALFPSYWFYCATTDPELARVAAGSVHKNAYMSCSAAFQTSGAYRSGGTLGMLYVN